MVHLPDKEASIGIRFQANKKKVLGHSAGGTVKSKKTGGSKPFGRPMVKKGTGHHPGGHGLHR